MQKYLHVLAKTALFKEMTSDEIQSLYDCLGFYVKKYLKDEIVLLAGNKATDVGIVLSGRMQVLKEDIMGNQSILTELSEADLFAETFACAGISTSPVTVVAVTACEVLFIRFTNIITGCANACNFHNKLVENMLKLISQKNLMLQVKIDILSQRSIRDKLLHYFGFLKEQQKKNTVITPFNRTELADYLCVDRSAMSRELSNMKDEGILDFDKNQFTI